MEEKSQPPEFWLRGPVQGVPELSQPVAHALLQAQLEVHGATREFPASLLWKRPANNASVAFHLQHLSGVLDRLFTYARAEQLSEKQLEYLRQEGDEDASISTTELIDSFDGQIKMALSQLSATDPATLLEKREVGRKKIPSTVLGLLFHAAEHTQRHTGQLLVTVKVLLHSW